VSDRLVAVLSVLVRVILVSKTVDGGRHCGYNPLIIDAADSPIL
jgi:hypothetical protein